MSRAGGVLGWLRTLLKRAESDARMDIEFAFHIDMESRRLEAAGLSPKEARRRALMSFGGVERHRQELREGRGLRGVWVLIRDVRSGARSIRRRPAFTLTVGFTLAVGMAALATAYALAYGVLLRPLPYPDGDRLIMVWQTVPGWERFPASWPIYERWSEETSVFTGLAAFGTSESIVMDGARPERVAVSPATANLSDVLGVAPLIGRWFTEAEDRRGDAVVVVSYEYWRTRLGSDSLVVGRVLRLDDQARTIVGVMPVQFRFPREGTVLWTPLGPDARQRGWTSQSLAVIGRLLQTATVDMAAHQTATVTARAVASGDSPPVGSRTILHRDDVLGGVRPTILLALATAAAVLLIGVLNVTNLFLARGADARRETAVKRALGAGGARIAGEFIAEGVLLGVASSAAGLLAVALSLSSLAAALPTRVPRIAEVAVDLPVVLVLLGAGAAVGMLLGLIAALTAVRDGATSIVGAGTRHTAGRHALRFRALIMGAQVAGVFALVSAAGLLLQSHGRLLAEERGFDDARLVALVEPQPLESRYPDAAAREELFQRVARQLAGVAGVESAALVAPLPFSGSERNTSITGTEGGEPIAVGATEVTAGGLEMLGVRLMAGRTFGRDDEGGAAAVAVVSAGLARLLRPDGRVAGAAIGLGDSGSVLRIVGVVADVRQELDTPPIPRVWLPWSRNPGDDVSVVAAVAGDPTRIVPALRDIVAEAEPSLAAETLVPMADLVHDSAAFQRFRALLLFILAGAAGTIAAIGIYGVMSYAVAERSPELSIRHALGAGPRRLVRDGLGMELRIVVFGLAAGVPTALLLGRLLQRFLHNVGPADPATHAATALAVCALAVIAALVPVMRAVRTDPMQSLREE